MYFSYEYNKFQRNVEPVRYLEGVYANIFYNYYGLRLGFQQSMDIARIMETRDTYNFEPTIPIRTVLITPIWIVFADDSEELSFRFCRRSEVRLNKNY